MLLHTSVHAPTNDTTVSGCMAYLLLQPLPWSTSWSAMCHVPLACVQIEYLLCYAAAGTLLQFSALERGTNEIHRLGPELDLQDAYQRAHAITTAVKLFFILIDQADRLPINTLLGGTVRRPNGTSIFKGDTFVEKQVDLSLQPELAAKVQLMEEVYCCVQGCEQLVQLRRVDRGVKVQDGHYTVYLVPRGKELSTTCPPCMDELPAAIRCAGSATCNRVA